MESAPLNRDDDLVVKGRRILSLAAPLEDGLHQTKADVSYNRPQCFRTLIDIEFALLNRDDDLVVKGRRTLSLADPLEDGLEQTLDDRSLYTPPCLRTHTL